MSRKNITLFDKQTVSIPDGAYFYAVVSAADRKVPFSLLYEATKAKMAVDTVGAQFLQAANSVSSSTITATTLSECVEFSNVVPATSVLVHSGLQFTQENALIDSDNQLTITTQGVMTIDVSAASLTITGDAYATGMFVEYLDVDSLNIATTKGYAPQSEGTTITLGQFEVTLIEAGMQADTEYTIRLPTNSQDGKIHIIMADSAESGTLRIEDAVDSNNLRATLTPLGVVTVRKQADAWRVLSIVNGTIA